MEYSLNQSKAPWTSHAQFELMLMKFLFFFNYLKTMCYSILWIAECLNVLNLEG